MIMLCVFLMVQLVYSEFTHHLMLYTSVGYFLMVQLVYSEFTHLLTAYTSVLYFVYQLATL